MKQWQKLFLTFCLCLGVIGGTATMSVRADTDDSNTAVETVKDREGKEKEKEDTDKKEKDEALKDWYIKKEEAQKILNDRNASSAEKKKAQEVIDKANKVEKEYDDLESGKTENKLVLDYEDKRDSAFGGFVKSFMSVSIPIGTKNFDFGNLEKSFRNFIELSNIKSWSVGNVNIYNNFFKNGVYTAVASVGSTLCVLFLVVGVLKDALAFDRLDWRRVLAQILKTGVLVYFIDNAWKLLELVASATEEITTLALDHITSNVSTPTLSIGQLLNNVLVYVHQQGGGDWWGDIMGTVMEVLIFVFAIIIAVIYYKTILDIVLMVFQRLFKLLFAFSIAPIPMALTMSEGSNGQGIFKYCVWVAGIVLEGLVMLVAIKLYSVLWSGLLGSVSGDYWTILGIILVGVILLNGLLKVIVEAGQRVIEQFSR